MQRAEISPILNYYGVVHRDITTWQSVLCPVHDDSRRSARVKIDEDGKGWLECLGCGFSGNEIALVQTKENVDAEAAVEFAARHAHAGSVRLSRGTSWRGSGEVSAGQGYRPRFGGRGALRTRRSTA